MRKQHSISISIQTEKHVEMIFGDIAGIYISYDFKDLCRELWKSDQDCPYIDSFKSKSEKFCAYNQYRLVICMHTRIKPLFPKKLQSFN